MNVKATTRLLRKRQTAAEKILWERVRNRRLSGKKFLRQHAVYFEMNNERRFIIADFYCAERKLIVEVDGKIHERQADYDRLRDWITNQLGFSVVRFKNDEIEFDTDKAMNRLLEYVRG